MIGALHRRLLHDRRRAGAGLRLERRDRAVGRVADVVEGRDVHAALGGEPAVEVAGDRRRRRARASARGSSTSPSPAVMTSANGASGSGFTNVTAPPITTSGSCFVRASARTGHAREAQHRDARWCSPTRTRRRRRRTSKSRTGVSDSTVRSGLPEASCAASSWRAGQEHALAHDVLQLVEEPVDRLEAQVGHSDEVRVRERERDAEAAAVRFADVADFA